VPNDFNTKRHFKSGEWIFFDNAESKDVASFKLESGTCGYEGPFRHLSFELCADKCRDFATLAEALE
jgi:hypothetical protein